MLEKLRYRIPEHWKTKLAPLAEWLILAEPQLRLTDDMDGDAIRREVAVYVKRCVRWQAKERQAMQARRDRAQSKWGQKPEHRPTWVLFLGFIGLAFLVYVLFLAEWQLSANLKFWEASIAKWAEPSTLLGALAGAPVAFMIWRYRDQNTLWQIENQRKDINLKDFQKLAEWASGQHLQEDKVVEQTKRTEKATANGSEVTTETVTTREGSAPPDHARSVNKRTGGESLQVAAVYQLQAFLDGDFGKQFQRPAFQLLKSLWEGHLQNKEVSDQIRVLKVILEGQEIEQEDLDWWREKFATLIYSPLGRALHESLMSQTGLHLYLHPQDVSGILLMGVNTRISGLKPWTLAGLNLRGANLQAAHLLGAKLQGVDLSFAKLQATRLDKADLAGANLEEVDWHSGLVDHANLAGANLYRASLSKVFFYKTNLRGICLSGALLRDAILVGADLRGANLSGADLCGANLCDVQIDSFTNLVGATYDSSTKFGKTGADGVSITDASTEETRWRALGARRPGEAFKLN